MQANQNGQLIKTFNYQSKQAIFSLDGSILALINFIDIILIRLNDGEEIERLGQPTDSQNGSLMPVKKLDLSPDANMVACIYERDQLMETKKLTLWNRTEKKHNTIIQQSKSYHYSISFSHDGQQLAYNDNRDVSILDIDNGNTYSLKGHQDDVVSVQYSSNGKYLVSGDLNNYVNVWSTQIDYMIATNTLQLLYSFKPHTAYVSSLLFSPNGQFLASTGDDRKIKIWNIETRQCVMILDDSNFNISFSHDGGKLASCCYGQKVKIWNLESKECAVFETDQNLVYSVELSPKENCLVTTAGYQEKVELWSY